MIFSNDELDFGSGDMPTKKFLDTCSRIEAALRSVADEGTNIDTGGGLGSRDFWVKIDGTEFFIQVSTSKASIENSVFSAFRGPLAS